MGVSMLGIGSTGVRNSSRAMLSDPLNVTNDYIKKSKWF
jgi:hypothetical protein